MPRTEGKRGIQREAAVGSIRGRPLAPAAAPGAVILRGPMEGRVASPTPRRCNAPVVDPNTPAEGRLVHGQLVGGSAAPP
jgi:hypothetical protein